ncbi:putative kinetochore protein [Erysiphe neolycopersici]|uniref:Putative kinetochore protein n=1 Tax=Erysiphe neolycopersici TaxID=212602 RepID=A0A420H7K4_9PEZI|nr:putative kinetochore protein [Erysiphe neolycopersici]
MDSSAPTIIELKADFLRKQIHILSEPLRPSAEFYASRRFRESSLDKKTIEKVLHQLNKRLKRHNNLAYGRRAQRHVAEQVDRLTWDTPSQNQFGKVFREAWAEIGTDYCASESIENLPDEWPKDIDNNQMEDKEREQEQDRETGLGGEVEVGQENIDKYEILNQRYTELRCNLADLNTKRYITKERLEKLNSIRDILKNFKFPMEIQKNLVTRGGELEQELERSCRLMLRIERGMSTGGPLRSRIETDIEHNDQVDLNGCEERKVLDLITKV